MLVFDLTNQESFNNIRNVWKIDFLNKAMPKEPESFPFFLMGNKADLDEEREVQ